MAAYEVLGIGAAMIDQIVAVDDVFLQTHLPGEKGGTQELSWEQFKATLAAAQALGAAVTIVPGGSSCNTIKGISRLGLSCAFLGKIGNDDFRIVFENALEQAHVLSKLIPTEHNTSRVASYVTSDGQRTMRFFAGASSHLQAHDLCPQAFEGIKLLHMEGYSLYNGYDFLWTAMMLAKEAGALVSLDIGSLELAEGYKDIIFYLMSRCVDVVFANENEVVALTGLQREWACEYLLKYCPNVVVMAGAQGCFAGDRNEILQCPASEIKVVDTTGAGDVFASGFLYAKLNGYSLNDCARLGNRLAGAVCQVIGAELPAEQWRNIKSVVLNS